MADKMLIDASHEEETRVVVVRGNRIEEFDFESQHKKQLRGNIYLAKVTRVEPSLQAAFVDYGGNRHGFLAFSEIHPDYYQIPLADRQALLAAEAEAEAERARSESDDDDARDDDGEDDDTPKIKEKSRRSRGGNRRSRKDASARSGKDEAASDDDAAEDPDSEGDDEAPANGEAETVDSAARDLEGEASTTGGGDKDDDGEDGDDDSNPRSMAATVETDSVSEPVDDEDADRDPGEVDIEAAKFVEGKTEDQPRPKRSRRKPKRAAAKDSDRNAAALDDDEPAGNASGREDQEDENGGRVESVGAEDAMEEVPDRSPRKPRKQYRIQEVIKRRQILLVQVVKEERGNKGAALTTYLSLAGRYSVLMPNTARGGGISRKITNIQDRKRLKEIAKGLDVPQGMGVILRTAGANRTKAEIKRDFEYLMRLWENVRNLTLASTAPCLVYEEGSLIKRSIRDLYNKDISQIVVSGEEGYREAKDFMKMLMPSHAKVVQPYRDVHPIFSRSGIEAQLDRMLQPQVTLKSGGYIIINQTEALVAIDVNSGRSTKEHSIEDTALQTNLEAADEVARQLRLRDLAGLIVVDFIDMEEKRNNRAVEKRLKDALKNDRARIQVGRISHFGLLEMSRQRIRASVLESTTQVCEHCGGSGHVRSQSSVALHVIRSIEDYLLKSTTHDIVVRTTPDTALYVLNQKRATITEMERRFGVTITIEADATIGSAHLDIQKGDPVEEPVRIQDIVAAEIPEEEPEDEESVGDADQDETDTEEQSTRADDQEGNGQSKRRRRRRRRGGRDRDQEAAHAEDSDDHDSPDDPSESGQAEQAAQQEDGRPKKRRRRGKRGGRRNRAPDDAVHAEAGTSGNDRGDEARNEDATPQESDRQTGNAEPAAAQTVESGPTTAEAADETPAEANDHDNPSDEVSEEKPKARRSPRRRKRAEPEETTEGGQTVAHHGPDEPSEPAKEKTEARTSEPVVISNGGESRKKEDGTEEKPKKVGWWQRRSFF